jgi:uncharacterized protein YciI
MELDQYYVVLSKKGPNWAPGSTPELEALQRRHLAHKTTMHQAGNLIVAGPVQPEGESDLRGIDIFHFEAFESLEELKALVEADPVVQAGRLALDYLTWYVPKGTTIRL